MQVFDVIHVLQNLPVTKIVDSLMDVRTSPQTEHFRYFDPKLLKTNDATATRSRSQFTEV